LLASTVKATRFEKKKNMSLKEKAAAMLAKRALDQASKAHWESNEAPPFQVRIRALVESGHHDGLACNEPPPRALARSESKSVLASAA
jgi:hypothetical protein